ncbi:MAG: hypothetical protein IKI28_01015 [Bacteroidales bacterium]|nr:hypothetical protein [Bacteroidales bacterium]
MKIKNLSLSFLLLLPLFGWAQNNEQHSDNTNPFINEFGANAGLTTGVGLSYRHWFNKFGVQVTALPIKESNYTFISGGLTGMYSMHNTKYIRIFAYWGNHVYHEGHSYTSYQETNTNNNDVKYYGSTEYNTGVGLGFSFGRVVAFNISVGYGAYNVFGGAKNLSLLPTGEMGLYWRF